MTEDCLQGPSWREADRLAALERYAVLDTEREAPFDNIVQLASDICETPIAVVNFIADGRQWFKAETGIGARELPLDVSICRHAILQPGLFVVPDLTQDPRFARNPLVLAAGGLRFYAGALLETPEGLPLGTVCVLDTKTRPEGLNERQERLLRTLARQVMSELELRRAVAARDTHIALTRASEARFRAVFDQAAVGIARVALDGRFLEVNDGFCAITGRSREELTSGDFLQITHPEDLAADCAQVRRLMAGEIGSYELEKRYLTKAGATVWVNFSASLVRDAAGQPETFVAVIEDISARKRMEESRQLLVRELNHRVKNLFAIASGMINMTARSTQDTREMAQVLTGRLMALSKAHGLIQGAVTGEATSGESVALHELVTAVVAPHLSASADQLRLKGPLLQVGPGSVTSLALVLHELATNAAKYGALSVAQGCLEVAWRPEGQRVILTWDERGGPVVEPPKRKGFGSQLAHLTVDGQLGGSIGYDWRPEGVHVTIDAPAARLGE